jgi:peptidoglycan/LPS O-acetylase OafA/YrhL
MALGVALASPIAVKDLPLDLGGRLACAGFGLFVLPCPLSPVGIMYPTNPPEWSLLYEVLGHVAFALMFAPLRRMRSLLAVICAAGCLFALGIWRYRGFYFDDTFHAVPFELGRIGFCFFTGVLVRRTKSLWTSRLPSLPAWLAYALLLALLAAPPPAVLRGALELVLGLVATPAVVVLAANATAQGRIGDVSMRLALMAYPLYAVHLPIIILTHNLTAGWGIGPAVKKSLAVMLAVAMAMVLPAIYDVPVRR